MIITSILQRRSIRAKRGSAPHPHSDLPPRLARRAAGISSIFLGLLRAIPVRPQQVSLSEAAAVPPVLLTSSLSAASCLENFDYHAVSDMHSRSRGRKRRQPERKREGGARKADECTFEAGLERSSP